MSAKVKNLVVGKTGIEFEVRNAGGDFLGDLFVTGTGLTWCRGRTSRENGKTAIWSKFIALMDDVDDT